MTDSCIGSDIRRKCPSLCFVRKAKMEDLISFHVQERIIQMLINNQVRLSAISRSRKMIHAWRLGVTSNVGPILV